MAYTAAANTFSIVRRKTVTSVTAYIFLVKYLICINYFVTTKSDKW